MRRQPFTLIEMLVVILLAVTLMGMGASAFKRLSDSQKLSIGAGAVKAALHQARAHALKTKKVTSVYFLDAGSYDYPNDPGDYKTYIDDGDEDITYGYYGREKNEDTEEEDGTDMLHGKLAVPCELLIVADDEIVNDIKLPKGIAWLDLNGAPVKNSEGDEVTYTGLFSKVRSHGSAEDIPLINRRSCSLVILFSPNGSVWKVKYGTRTELSCANIRIFNTDELPSIAYSGAHSKDTNGPFTVVNFDTDPVNKRGEIGNKRISKVQPKFNWLTVQVNYLTGIADIISGRKESTYDKGNKND